MQGGCRRRAIGQLWRAALGSKRGGVAAAASARTKSAEAAERKQHGRARHLGAGRGVHGVALDTVRVLLQGCLQLERGAGCVAAEGPQAC